MTAGLFLSLGATAFVGECSYAATTFGTAILFQIGWEISFLCGVGDGRVSGAVVNLAVAEVFMSAVQSVYLFRDFHLKFFVSTVGWICSSVVLGCWLLLRLEDGAEGVDGSGSSGDSTSTLWVKRSLGWFLFAVACLRVFVEFCYGKTNSTNTDGAEEHTRGGDGNASDRSNSNRQMSVNSSDGAPDYHRVSLLESTTMAGELEEHAVLLDVANAAPHRQPRRRVVPRLDLWSTQLAIAVSFSAAGILGGLYGVAGPPLMIFMVKYGDTFDMDTWRGTSAVMRLFFAGTRFAFLAAVGKISFVPDGTTNWPAFGVMCASGLVGLCVGNKLAPKIDQQTFRLLLLAFLVCGSLLLMCSGWQVAQDVVIVGILMMVALAILLWLGTVILRRCMR